MAWLVLEGLDRSGKSTIAELYKQKGFEIVHMSAPDKKYSEDGYTGPSYLDELLEIYMTYDGHDVVFDRSGYGELVWPHVYGREPMLSDDDIEILMEYEDRNSVERILMIDPDEQAHWKRCVDNKEPMNLHQFKMAKALFQKVAHQYNFIPRQLGDYTDAHLTDKVQDPVSTETKETTESKREVKPVPADRQTKVQSTFVKVSEDDPQEKLAQANAINTVLSARIIKRKGDAFDLVEQKVRGFLKDQLQEILGHKIKTQTLTNDEITILKLYCERIREKQSRR